MTRVAVIGGDGVGPAVVRVARRALETAGDAAGVEYDFEELPFGADHYLATGETLPEDAFDRLRTEFDAILLGALGDPRVPGNEHARDILLGLRFRLDLYINLRPARLLHPDLCPLKPLPGGSGRRIDLVVFRENTEGAYVGVGGTFKQGTREEIAINEDLNTYLGVKRIVQAAFEHAIERGRNRVTMCDKANALPHAHGLWRRVFAEVAAEYPFVKSEAEYVDALAMKLVRQPEHYGVIVTSNLFGDILSDLAAALVGGLGLAASANLHPGRPGLFEPVHGSAPDLAGTNQANPMAAVLAAALLAEHTGAPVVARALEGAVADAIRAGVRTPDLGGAGSTAAVGDWICGRLQEGAVGVG
ncbi:MAG TPA: isocitrate/isopropylmalate dehydrogenase family protein [Gemmatimonadota bacterium]|nr:isocitrate/isopropylmalate dehydrogenase family protein [Gemmatimonadota bacterium]